MTRTLRLFAALSTVSFVLTVLPLPQAFAATSFGELMKNSSSAPAFHYTFRGDAKFPITTATRSSIVDEDCYRKTPNTPCKYTTTHDSVQAAATLTGEGGKQGGVYSESGNLQLKVSGFDKIPSSLSSGFSEINLSTGYKSQYLEEGLTSLIELTSFHLDLNAPALGKVVNMVNELWKFPVGKVYKISKRDLKNTLQQYEALHPLSDDDMRVIEKIFQSKLSPEAFGKLVDGLIKSGVIKETSGGTASSHTFVLATSITKEGAKTLRIAIVDFIKSMNPAITNTDIQALDIESDPQLYKSLNKALKSAKKSKVAVTIREQDGKIQAFDFDLDVKGMGYPLTVKTTTAFDYTRGHTETLKSNTADIIDLNVIMDGIMSIGL